MPAAAIASAVANGLGSLAQPIIQLTQNRKNRKFAQKMYSQQRSDAVDFWKMQNAYNTPEQQMARFKAAGLNPNLIYGRGNEGNAGAVNVPSQAHWEGKAPDVASSGRGIMDAYFDARVKSQQVNNLGAQNDVLRSEAKLKDAQRISTLVGAARGSFDLGLRKESRASLLLALKNAGADKNALTNYHTEQSVNELRRGKLLDQSFDYLKRLNPVTLKKIGQTVDLLKQQGQLNAAALTRAIKSNRLIGISDKTEIGSLVRAILTIFNVDPSRVGR